MFATTNIVKRLLQLLFASANMDRMGNALNSGELDAEVADILASKMEELTISLRELSRRSGVKLTRLGDILRRGRPATVSEVNAVAAELGLVGWRVVQDAEQRIAAEPGRVEVEAAPASAAPAPKPTTPAPLQGYRTRWAGVREPHRRGPAIGERERMAALAGSADEDFGYPADAGEEPQD